MLKKITRRRFVSSLSVLAAMPLLSPRAVRAATGKTVSVDRYNNHDWNAAFKQAFTEGDTVVVTGGAWKETTGVVTAINPQKQLVTINVEMFGRETPVVISFAEVQKM